MILAGVTLRMPPNMQHIASYYFQKFHRLSLKVLDFFLQEYLNILLRPFLQITLQNTIYPYPIHIIFLEQQIQKNIGRIY